ncbi:Gfo/Idh/MocA family protein [Cohnella nanjingensis]|uniref:Gfo/Idh/MocA family oxidoreductase n=1 Tax=Cohnella nanjingensis TaxID=1387779 RepID=A0A7X0VG65_9BACL|nr:Gfo/Idh/MocA family oxidoreductase [Cohnella nanjingensis]MBB6671334.1 Gfo/Idh/MocA family oxidoreductase [Cohnella nanjingensis]
MDTIRVGLIGLGSMAQAHVRELEKLPRFRIAAICDVQEAALAEWGERLSVDRTHRHADYRGLIADEEVDAVVSITPNVLHADIMAVCLAANKPFLSEKPFTRTFAEAAELLARYDAHPVSALIGFGYRYTPAFRFAREMLAEGRIGAVRSFSMQYLQGWGAAVYNVPYVWRFDKAVTGTGTLGDLGAHMIDLAHYLFGPFEELSARLQTLIPERKSLSSDEMLEVEVDDFASFQARMTGGAAGIFQTSRNCIGSGNQLEVSIYGDLGTLHASTLAQEQVIWIRLDPDTGELSEQKLQVPSRARRALWEDFAEMLSGESADGLPDFRAGYENQKVLEAIVRSHEAKRTVALAELSAVGGKEE